jgi:PhnB protein
MNIYPFLNFNGNCSEAMHFYQACFGGQLHINYLADMRASHSLPKEMMHIVVSASLVAGPVKLFASDLMNEEGIFHGNRISLFFEGAQAGFVTTLFNRLSQHGEIGYPVSDKMRSGEWASLTDQYGVQWIFGLSHYK